MHTVQARLGTDTSSTGREPQQKLGAATDQKGNDPFNQPRTDDTKPPFLPATQDGFEPPSPGSEPGILPLDDRVFGGNIDRSIEAGLQNARASDRLYMSPKYTWATKALFVRKGGDISDTKNVRSGRTAQQVTRDVLSYWNQSYFHLDEIIYEVKQIDRRYSGAAVRREVMRLRATGNVKMRHEGRTIKYGWEDPSQPPRPYWGGEDHPDPSVSRQSRPLEPHEDIVSVDPWEEE